MRVSKADHSKGPTATGLPVDGGGVGGGDQPPRLGDMRKLHARPRSAPFGGSPQARWERPRATQGGAVAEGLPRREVQARQGVLHSKTTQGAQALRRIGVGSAEGFAC